MNQQQAIFELFNLSGRSALITGASGWLGSSMASALAAAGCRVVVTSRDAERAQQVADQLPINGSDRHLGVQLDQMIDPVSSLCGRTPDVSRFRTDVTSNFSFENRWFSLFFTTFERPKISSSKHSDLCDHSVT